MKRYFIAFAILAAFSLCGLWTRIQGFAKPAPQAATEPKQRGMTPVPTVGLARATVGSSFALVIGNNDYLYQPKLLTAVDDAKAVAAVLHDQYGFETTLLLNATRDQILKALIGYRRSIDKNSSLLIYYAGHGFRDQDADKSYWLPIDAAPSPDTSEWILADEITTDIKVLPARHILIISDSCYSGGMREGTTDIARGDEAIQRMIGGSSRYLMSSGGDEPVSDGGGGGHSVFTGALLYGLNSEQSAEFSGGMLFTDFIYRFVVGNSKQTPEYSPIRDAGITDGDFVFMRRSAAISTGAAAAPRPSVPSSVPPATSIPPSAPKPPPVEIMSLDNSLSTLQRAMDMMPTGDIGQSAAISSLIVSKHSLGGLDLSGLPLKNGEFDGGDFSKATMVDSDLSRVSAQSADFTQTSLSFAILNDAHLEGATLEGARLDFANAERAQFQNSKSAGLRWFSANARSVNFAGANLEGARFMFADLRDAVFDGADLTGTFFVGSDLTGASFKKAKLGNTDFTGSLLDLKSLDSSQRAGACQTFPDKTFAHVDVSVMEDIPNGQFEGGIEYRPFVDTGYYLWLLDLKLAACQKRQYEPDRWYPFFSANGKDIVTDIVGFGYAQKLIEKRGRDIRSRVDDHYASLQTAFKPTQPSNH